MRHVSLSLLACLVLAAGFAAEPPIRLPKAPPVEPKTVPDPAPTPAPGPLTLTADALYVIDCSVDAEVLVWPASAIKVTHETGPIRVRARFVGGSGEMETKVFAGPHVFILEANESHNNVGLFVVPKGYKDRSEIVHTTVNVDAGQGPIPPPKPKVDPVDPPGPDTGELRVLFIRETSPRPPHTKEQTHILNSTKIPALAAKLCAKDARGQPEFRVFDPDQKFAASESPDMRDLFTDSLPEARKQGLPAVVIARGKRATVYPLAALTEQQVLDLISKAVK